MNQARASRLNEFFNTISLMRPGYQKMLELVRNGGADVVMAESLDRFSRDQEHIAGFYKHVSHEGTKIVTVAEGEISELHIGLKGTMGALYLKDLAAKTHRGLEGVTRAGRFVGKPPYGYRTVRRLGLNGELERGLREIDPGQAVIVRRIFADYAAGLSPRAIAKKLNQDGIPGPTGGIWMDTLIRGQGSRDNGILRNPLFAGRLVWNRHRSSKDPMNGQRARRKNPTSAFVSQSVPEMAVIDEPLWQRVQDRIAREAPPIDPASRAKLNRRFCDRRRPVHLLSGKVFCGCCGISFQAVGKDYLSCRKADLDGCPNRRRVRRPFLEAKVLHALANKLMQPDLVETFIETFRSAWLEESGQNGGNADQHKKDLQKVERQIGNLIDAIADGMRAPDLQKRLDDLYARRAALEASLEAPAAVIPIIPANLSVIYKERLASLQTALAGPDNTEAFETARSLIDRIVINPGSDPDGPPDIELIGELSAMLGAGGLQPQHTKGRLASAPVVALFESSVKEGLRAKPLPSP